MSVEQERELVHMTLVFTQITVLALTAAEGHELEAFHAIRGLVRRHGDVIAATGEGS